MFCRLGNDEYARVRLEAVRLNVDDVVSIARPHRRGLCLLRRVRAPRALPRLRHRLPRPPARRSTSKWGRALRSHTSSAVRCALATMSFVREREESARIEAMRGLTACVA